MALKIWNDSPLSVPTVFLHSFSGNGENIWQTCHNLGCPAFNLVSIYDLDFDAVLTPWITDGVRKGQRPFGGKAESHLKQICQKYIKEVDEQLPAPSSYLALAGYSLAGLFAVWASIQNTPFRRFASVSGSLWYPGFTDYIQNNHPQQQPEFFYFSLGDKECRTKHPLMARINETTEAIYHYIQESGVVSCFEMNPGNHFTEPHLRMAKAIRWLLNQQK